MFKVCKQQLILVLSSPKIYIALIIGCIMHLISAMPLLEFSYELGKTLSIYESFIYFNCDTYTASAAFIGILLLVSDIPFSTEVETYTLLRISKRKWCMGKVLYLLSICTIYYLIVSIAGMLYISANAYMGNIWSESLLTMVKYPNAEIVLNSNVYFPYNHILLGFNPLRAFVSSLVLSIAYSFTVSLFIFLFNLKFSHKLSYVIAMMVHILGYIIAALLTSYFYMRFSLLGNSLLMYHSIGDYYNHLYFTVPESLLVFGILALVLIFFIVREIRKYNFNITVGAKS